MLEIKNLCLQAGRFQVNQVSFSVPASGCHALVGTTGSGKTLVLETIAGLRRAQSGSIHWLGRDIAKLPPEQRRLAYVPQDLALFPHMTVRGNIEYGLRMQKQASLNKYIEIDKLTQLLGIHHLLERSIRNLSGGERQRTALARALAPGSTLLLLDEPFSALHESMRKELWLLLKTLQQQYKITILIVTHDLEEAFFLADSITFIARGAVVQSGDKQQVYQCPANVEAAKFFGVQNLFEAKVTGQKPGITELFCPGLGMKLQAGSHVAGQLSTQTSVTVGIRAEHIAAIKECSSDMKSPVPNQTVCTVKHIHQKRRGQVLLLQPLNGTSLLEVDITGGKEFQLPKISVEQKVAISLPAEQILLFAG